MRHSFLLFVFIHFISLCYSQSDSASELKRKADSLFNRKSNLETAYSLYEEAEKQFRDTNQPVPGMKCAVNRIEILWRTGRLKDAEELASDSYQEYLNNQLDDPLVLAKICQNFGVIYDIQGDFNNSIQWHRNAEQNLVMASEVYWKDWYELYKYLSIAYKNASEYVEAVEIAEKAHEILQKNDPDNAFELSKSHSNVGIPYQYMGNYNKALKEFEKALNLILPEIEERYDLAALTMNNQALIYQHLNQPDTALHILLEGIDFYESNNKSGKVSLTLAYLHINAGEFLTKMNRSATAINYAKKGRNIVKHVQGDSRLLAIANTYLARAFYKNGSYDSAKYYSNKASVYYKSRNTGLRNLEYYDNLFLEAMLMKKDGELRDASAALKVLNQFYLEYVDYTFDLVSEYEREQIYDRIGNQIEIYKNYAANVEKDYRFLMDLMLNSKSILLKSNNRVRERIFASQDRVLIERYSELIELKQKYGKMIIENDESPEADSLMEVITRMDRELTQYSSIYEVESEQVNWKMILDKLGAREAALKIITIREYDFDALSFTDKTSYYGLLLRKSDVNGPVLIEFPDDGQMDESKLNAYRNAINYQTEDDFSYEYFWGFIEPYLRRTDVVYLSVDGILNNINFNTLKNPKTGKYLIQEIQINRVTNFESFLFPAEPLETQVKTAVLMGNPVFSEKAVNVTGDRIRGVSISELPGTEQEINRIELLLGTRGWEVETFQRENSSEKNIKKIRRPNLLHVATHGFFADDQSYGNNYRKQLFNSGLIFSDLNDISTWENFNELVRSSDNGILTSFEASELNIANTDLVILSACETGLGAIRNGEGVYGLQRSIIAAGARSLMMSFWKIDDQKTMDLMIAFYQNWLSGMDKRESLRKIQFDMIGEGLHPYYWGSFVIIGD